MNGVAVVHRVGVRREDKSIWERRVPLAPADIRTLREREGIQVRVQPSPIRVITSEEFREAGVDVDEDLAPCSVIVGVKEIPEAQFEPGKTYAFFSHTAKAQPYNMAMLGALMDLGCTLIDYERIVDDAGRRLIFFGRHAGLAGMVETLWALGRRLAWEGIPNPFTDLRHTYEYADLAAVKEAVHGAGERIRHEGLPRAVVPLTIGVAGYGNVAKGTFEILDELPLQEIAPSELPALVGGGMASPREVYKVVFKEEHTVEPLEPGHQFALPEFYTHPELYRGVFTRHVPFLSVLVNCVYWEAKYPRLVTKAFLRRHFDEHTPRLRVIGDISADIEGAVECDTHTTEADNPVYVFDPATGETVDGVAGAGPVVMAVDILPTELPRDASHDFSRVLVGFIPAIARADYSVSFEELALPPDLKRAVIVHRGELAPEYRHLEQFAQRRSS
jgi:alanine dehydrogenase